MTGHCFDEIDCIVALELGADDYIVNRRMVKLPIGFGSIASF
jgi:hypothetical protein